MGLSSDQTEKSGDANKEDSQIDNTPISSLPSGTERMMPSKKTHPIAHFVNDTTELFPEALEFWHLVLRPIKITNSNSLHEGEEPIVDEKTRAGPLARKQASGMMIANFPTQPVFAISQPMFPLFTILASAVHKTRRLPEQLICLEPCHPVSLWVLLSPFAFHHARHAK